ncbi:Bacteriophage protein [Mycobacteroides abscessus subsp. abscessus]|uniref:large terminase n=1 Tax=Mycobacteroides abscessus TaxID=36809 RepID=UPI0009A6BD72|nr:large terminase [Mycobacteroides abscessus]PVB58090.1 large terminase [Mycobacteroides abscessus]RIR78602.1 large terminase [Mycobacteroides abscessus]SKF77516.1 Bacteriophage protein [Mycobacteroides abscessus subsp. abscessus]
MAVLIVPPLDLSYPTLGPQVCQFIEERMVFGPGSLSGQPARLDDEKRGIIYRLYEIYPQGHRLAGRRRFQRGAIEVRKGLAKTELAAWISGCELHPEAPVRCDGFDAHGNPVGRPVESPVIPMMAVTEEQVEELAYGVLKYVLENGPDSELFVITKEKIIRKGWNGTEDGFVVAVSNAPGSRDGARTTFQHFDEPHRLFMQRMRDAHETMLQNMPKRPLEDPWTLYTSTAGQPGQNSIEEDVLAEAEAIDKGEVDDPSLFFFRRWAGDEHRDLSTVENRIAAVADATGPVGEWGVGQFERIAKDYDRKGIDKAYWERVWLNRWRKSGYQAFDMLKVESLRFEDEDKPWGPIPDGAFVTAGFDGARFRDATALTITDIETGRQMLLGCWERPDNAEDWEIPEDEVTDLVTDMMSRYEVWRMYCDPPHWTETVASWAARFPDQVVEWFTQRKTPMAAAVRAYVEAIDSGIVTYGENAWQETLIKHMGNAGRHELKLLDDQGAPLWILQKQDGRLEDKFDAAMSAVLSWTACVDARRSGARPRPKSYVPRRIY